MKVAVALISDNQDRFLITQRPMHASHGGYWEFPGGKLESNESAEEALIREIKEELGLEILKHEYLGTIQHQYPDYLVELYIFKVLDFSGEPSCLEGQLSLRWVKKNEIDQENFPQANRGIWDLI